MDLSVRFRPAGSRVIHEMFENEVVVVNLDSGRYYCLQQAGADIWQLMLAGQNVGEIATTLTEMYDAPATTLAEATDRLCRELCEEALLTVAETGEPAAAHEPPQLAPSQPRRPFEAPRLQVYTDMQDLLLLDPIHEVDAKGWPLARSEDPARPR